SAVPINGVSSGILANTSSGSYDLRIPSAVPLGGNQQMTLKLGTSNGAILINPDRTIRIDTPIADAAGVAGGFTVQGGGYLDLAGTTTFTGTVTVVGSLMQLEGSA